MVVALRVSVLAVLAGCGSSGGGAAKDDAGGAGGSSHPATSDAGADGPASCPNNRCPTTLASAQGAPWAIALDSANVYWVNLDSAQLMKVPIAGGTATSISYVQYSSAGYGLYIDGTNGYWIAFDDIYKAPLAGGAATTVVTGRQAQWVAGDANGLYFSSADGSVSAVGFSGGTLTPLFTSQDSFSTGELLAAGGNVYFTFDGLGFSTQVMKVPVMGGTPATTASGSLNQSPLRLAVFGSNLYWSSSGGLMKAPLASSGPGVVVVPTPMYEFAVDGTDVYFSDASTNSLFKASLGGGAPVVIATGQEDIGRVAVDANNVYWLNGGPDPLKNTGTVMKLAKK